MNNYITIQINGEPFNCVATMSLPDLMTYLNIDIQQNLLEHNGKIVHLGQLDQVCLQNYDTLEVITIAGGG